MSITAPEQPNPGQKDLDAKEGAGNGRGGRRGREMKIQNESHRLIWSCQGERQK